MLGRIYRFLKDKHGGSALEYAVMAGFLAMIIYGSVVSLGQGLFVRFNSIFLP
jgi:Flp pilus assembly pilin Flp